jgi:hypothetical protein
MNGQLGECLLEISQHGPFPASAGAIPQFEPDEAAPAGFSIGQSTLNSAANFLITLWPKKMYPRRRVHENHDCSALATQRSDPVCTHEIATGAGMLHQRRHSAPAIEVHEGCDYRLALCTGFRESHGFSELRIWNINSRFHDSIIINNVIQIHFGNNPQAR